MSENFFLSDFKIKRICPYCQSYKVELIKKSNTNESYISMLTTDNTDQWGVMKQNNLVLKCIHCMRVFKFTASFTFSPFTTDDLKDEKAYLIDYLNDLSLNKILFSLNQIIVMLNTDPLNAELWDKFEMIFLKLKNDRIKIIIEKPENKADVIFFSYYQLLAKLRIEKSKAISKQEYEKASKIKVVEKQYSKWKTNMRSIAFINKKHFYLNNRKNIIYKTSVNPFLNQEIIKMIIGMMETSDIQNILYLQYFTD
jgi:hypothetical protein